MSLLLKPAVLNLGCVLEALGEILNTWMPMPYSTAIVRISEARTQALVGF